MYGELIMSPQNPQTRQLSFVRFFLPSTYDAIVQFADVPYESLNSKAFPVTLKFLYCLNVIILVMYLSILKVKSQSTKFAL